MEVIDKLAEDYFKTRDKKCFDKFVKHATPVIRGVVTKSCAGSFWDADELFSILLVDMWRLFKKWRPVEGKKFHWLMLRQLRNKTINYVHSQIGARRKICPICGARQKIPQSQCNTCKSSLRKSDIIISEPFESKISINPDYPTQLANTQLIQKLLGAVEENDPKTHKILTMFLEGESKTAISAEIGIAQNAINNRLRKCQKIIHKLMKETL